MSTSKKEMGWEASTAPNSTPASISSLTSALSEMMRVV